MYMHDRFNGVVICANKEGGFDEWDDDVLLALGDQAGAILQNGRLQGQLRDAYMSTVALLAEAVAAKDPFVHANAQEVSSYVEAVAQRLDVPPGRREELLFGSLLHDVGKLGISERILLKAAPLTPEERSVVELHPRIGARLVEQVPALQPIVQGVLHHHERWDGAGYPEGLAGDDIPLPARIIGVADAFSAMTANRPYRRRLSIDEACAELERCAGSQFDPEVVEAFVDEVRRAPSQSRTPLSIALSDPVVDTWRTDHEPVLGYAASAHIDGLTFLPTHRPLHEAADAAARAARARGDSFAVVMVELTELNDLNRIEGWAAGDDALRTVAAALARLSLDHGGTAGREGGAVLGVVLPGADEARATGVGRALLAELDGRPVVRVTLAASRPDETGEDVMARARAGVAVDATPAAAPAPAPGTEVPPTPSV
jgi:diguanylate cyclase (GGDEF)-like protein